MDFLENHLHILIWNYSLKNMRNKKFGSNEQRIISWYAMMIKNYFYSFFLALFSLVTIQTNAEGITELSATPPKNQATRAQINPLLMTVQVHFPQSVQTVGGYGIYCATPVYALVDPAAMSKDAQQMLTQPLPIVDRSLGPLSSVKKR